MEAPIDKSFKKRGHLFMKAEKAFNSWWGSRSSRPALIFSFLGVGESKDSVANTVQLKFLCKTLLKILPPNALLIAGGKDGEVDNIIREEILQTSKLKSGKIQTDTQELDKEKDEDAFELSMYHEGKNLCIKTHNWTKYTIEVPFYTAIENLLANIEVQGCTPMWRGHIHPPRTILAKFHFAEEELHEQGSNKFVVIRPKFEEFQRPGATEKRYSEERLCKSIYSPIFHHCAEEKPGQPLCHLICDQWYDAVLSKAILEQISRRKIPKFYFEEESSEKWIIDHLKTHIELPTANTRGEYFELPSEPDLKRSEKEQKKPEPKKEAKDARPEPRRGQRRTYLKQKILMIWCVQEEMHTDVTMTFWHKGKADKLAMSLTAYKVSKNLLWKYDSTETGEAMKHQMQFFDTMSIEHLLKCYSVDKGVTMFQLLIGRIKEMNDVSPIEIAMDAGFEAFIAQTPCKLLMDGIWIEPLRDYKEYNYVTFVISLLFPFLAPLLVDVDTGSELYITDREDNVDELKHEYSLEERCLISLRRSLEHNACCKANCNCFAKCLDYFWKVRTFLQASVVRFIYALIFHLTYLTIFSIVLLTDFHPKISLLEMILDAWTLVLAIEEIKQALNEGKDYLNKWNLLDNLGLILFIVGFTLRTIYHVSPLVCPEGLYIARNILAFSLLFFFIRSLQLLIIHATLGPKIHMMTQLLGDLVSFMLILAVFIGAYGVVSNVVLYPNQPLSFTILTDIFYNSWWSVLGQYTREEVSGLNCAEDPSENITAEYCASMTNDNIDYVKCKEHKCPANNWIVSVLLAGYSLVTVIMMLNVLVAMFNNTFSGVESKKREVYNLQRYKLMREYSIKSVIPVPLCFVTYWRFLPWCILGCVELLRSRSKDELEKRSLWTLFRRNSSDRAAIVENQAEIEDTKDKASKEEIGEVKDILVKLTKSEFQLVKQMLSSLPQKSPDGSLESTDQ